MNIVDLLRKYDISVPRYTSYPTANHFSEAINAAHYQRWLPHLPEDEPVSVYLHIPFCHRLCRYCGCHTKILRDYEPARTYTDALRREIESVSFLLGPCRKVSYLHWGGGTPTFLDIAEIEGIMETLRSCFDMTSLLEHAMEIDPRTIDAKKAKFLASIGINRVSLGIQDFDPHVQKAIDRIQPFEKVREVTDWLRNSGIEGINFDMIYGLPLQSEQSIRKSMKMALELKPGRLAVFGYAHVPWFKKHQELLSPLGLPGVIERYHLQKAASDELTNAGYVETGIDHFTTATDPMALALKEKRLYRNFQGYTTDNCRSLLGFGASAISITPKGYLQNNHLIKEYRVKTGSGLLATSRGAATKGEDLIRRSIIGDLMCYGKADFSSLSPASQNRARARIAVFISDSIAELDGNEVKVTEAGKPFTRLVCTAFDTRWNETSGKHAKAV